MLIKIGEKFVNANHVVKVEPLGLDGYTVSVVGTTHVSVRGSKEGVHAVAERINAAIRASGGK